MPDIHFADRLAEAVKERQNSVVVGLDPRCEHLPAGLRPADTSRRLVAAAYRSFCQGIIDVVAPLVPAVKPQMAFFEQLGACGMSVLEDVIEYARGRKLLVILDGKRNDIGSTAAAYADAYLGGAESAWRADALTVSPYLGDDSLAPFVSVARQRAAGLFVLVKTSNPGGRMLQDLQVGPQRLFEIVAAHVEALAAQSAGAGGYGCVGAVAGATYPEQLAGLRTAMPHTWLLVPGFGSQGGTARDVAGGFDTAGLGALINSSRAIIFAHDRPEYRDRFGSNRWQEAVEAATRETIDQLRVATPAGKLTR